MPVLRRSGVLTLHSSVALHMRSSYPHRCIGSNLCNSCRCGVSICQRAPATRHVKHRHITINPRGRPCAASGRAQRGSRAITDTATGQVQGTEQRRSGGADTSGVAADTHRRLLLPGILAADSAAGRHFWRPHRGALRCPCISSTASLSELHA
jgi:hypothetical protein